MLKLGVNTVLFKKYSLEEAARAIKLSGYDGMEISAIEGMCDHIDLDNYKQNVSMIKETSEKYELQLLSTEVASRDEIRLLKAFEACQAIGIPIVNIGPGGKSDVEEDIAESIEAIAKLSEKAQAYGVTLCVKAHVNAAIYNTPTTLRAMSAITSPAFGIDMDPSHIHRANENPEEALKAVVSRVKHVHIRDCCGRGPSPGEPTLQACGRGDINLYGYFKVLVDAGYEGPVCLEVIGPELDMTEASIIAAESYGYMNACLKHIKEAK